MPEPSSLTRSASCRRSRSRPGRAARRRRCRSPPAPSPPTRGARPPRPPRSGRRRRRAGWRCGVPMCVGRVTRRIYSPDRGDGAARQPAQLLAARRAPAPSPAAPAPPRTADPEGSDPDHGGAPVRRRAERRVRRPPARSAGGPTTRWHPRWSPSTTPSTSRHRREAAHAPRRCEEEPPARQPAEAREEQCFRRGERRHAPLRRARLVGRRRQQQRAPDRAVARRQPECREPRRRRRAVLALPVARRAEAVPERRVPGRLRDRRLESRFRAAQRARGVEAVRCHLRRARATPRRAAAARPCPAGRLWQRVAHPPERPLEGLPSRARCRVPAGRSDGPAPHPAAPRSPRPSRTSNPAARSAGTRRVRRGDVLARQELHQRAVERQRRIVRLPPRRQRPGPAPPAQRHAQHQQRRQQQDRRPAPERQPLAHLVGQRRARAPRAAAAASSAPPSPPCPPPPRRPPPAASAPRTRAAPKS